MTITPVPRDDEEARAVEALVRDYIRLWNARDAAAIWSRVYRFEPDGPFRDEAGIRDALNRLDAAGFARTELHSVEACRRGPAEARARISFTRLKTDGTPMPPGRRAAIYALRRYADGWRITAILPAT